MRYDRSTMPTNDSPSERYRQLVMWLRDQYRGARGWQAQAARRLNVHPVTLSKFLTGDRSTVGLDIIERAILSLPIDREYFFSPHPSSDPGLWMFPRDRPGAPAEDGETERFFWLTVSTKIGPSPLNREKLAELDEETLEMVASERRFFARYFAENFPEVVEARRLANVTPETTLRELGEILHSRRAYLTLVESTRPDTWRVIMTQGGWQVSAYGVSFADAIAESLLMIDRAPVKAGTKRKAGAR